MLMSFATYLGIAALFTGVGFLVAGMMQAGKAYDLQDECERLRLALWNAGTRLRAAGRPHDADEAFKAAGEDQNGAAA